ncbi:O-antigen polymerase [Rosistilla oblonga]|uniref:Oligosaccharide repeat unit polymerase n=1 Tax=Rosistilla oblonga TaxID=2527990 RepID=A0A518IQ45_9BACT|nr:O-antigen polymerase [Rosistilla oblonga]QDV55215.1 hypothetical protein Mal33_11850 [Rosistilla oblonga]
MTSILHLFIFVFCAVAAGARARFIQHNLFSVLVFAGIGVIHGLVPLLRHTWLRFPETPEAFAAALYCAVGLPVFVMGWIWGQKACKQELQTSLVAGQIRDKSPLFKLVFWICVTAATTAFFLRLWVMGISISDALHGGRFEFRFSGGPIAAMVSYGCLLSMIPGFLGFLINRKYALFGVIFCIAFTTLVFVVSRGSRGLPLGILGSGLVGFLISRPRIKTLNLAIVSFVTIAILSLAISLYEIRKQLATSTATEIGQLLISGDAYADLLTRDPLNYHQMFVQVCKMVPTQADYTPLATQRRILFFFVPHSRFPELKPEDVNATIGHQVFMLPKNAVVTIPPTIPGDAYINFCGYPGIVYLLALGWAIGATISLSQRSYSLYLSATPCYLYYVMMGIRGQPYELFLEFVFLVASTNIVIWTLQRVFNAQLPPLKRPSLRRVRPSIARRQVACNFQASSGQQV